MPPMVKGSALKGGDMLFVWETPGNAVMIESFGPSTSPWPSRVAYYSNRGRDCGVTIMDDDFVLEDGVHIPRHWWPLDNR
jgi:hypothetical protein